MKKNYSIALDGPAGSGKSTVAKLTAKKLGFTYVDTGAMYRAIGLYFLRNNVDISDNAAVVKALSEIEVDLEYVDGEQQVMLNEENVNAYIRTEEVGKQASIVSALGEVREKLLSLQRNMAEKKSVIMDGRDIGTVVLPNATLKIYMEASAKIRAKRRYDELTAKGVSCDLDEIEKDIIARDERDMNREISPLKKADDAEVVDTSEINPQQVSEKIIELFEKKIAD